MPSAGSALAAEGENRDYRVMVVDDSAVIRGIFRRVLESDPGVKVVASVGNGQYAIDTLKRQPVDVVVLDIEMPVMDGMTALPLILKVDPEVRIIMASTLTDKNADISLRALELGAADYIPKPTSKSEMNGAEAFQRELLAKVKALGAARHRSAAPRLMPKRTIESIRLPAVAKAPQPIVLHKPSTASPKILAIGSSTGGPQALFKFFSTLKPGFDLPILITQHMPATFTKILAEHISKTAKRPCFESETGMIVEPGKIYLAAGDYHMIVEKAGDKLVLRNTQTAQENFCRPSVDPMLRSLIGIFGANVLMLMLTGMGHDGLDGSRALVAAGGAVVAQDEASSVVWGMPGAVATAGICCAVMPLDKLAGHICELARK